MEVQFCLVSCQVLRNSKTDSCILAVVVTAGPESGFSHFWITDSCPLTVQAVRGVAPFEVLSVADIIRSALHV